MTQDAQDILTQGRHKGLKAKVSKVLNAVFILFQTGNGQIYR